MWFVLEMTARFLQCVSLIRVVGEKLNMYLISIMWEKKYFGRHLF